MACESVANESYSRLYNGRVERYCESCCLDTCNHCGESTEDIAHCMNCGTNLCDQDCGLHICKGCDIAICKECNHSSREKNLQNPGCDCCSDFMYCEDCMNDDYTYGMCGQCGQYYCDKSEELISCSFCNAKRGKGCNDFKHCGCNSEWQLDKQIYICSSACDTCFEENFAECKNCFRCYDKECDHLNEVRSKRTKEKVLVCEECLDDEPLHWDEGRWEKI